LTTHNFDSIILIAVRIAKRYIRLLFLFVSFIWNQRKLH